MSNSADSPDREPRWDNHRLLIEYKPIAAITPNPRDPRTYSRSEIRRIAKALKHFGPLPLLVGADLQPLSGNVWLEAAKMAGLTEIPVIVFHHLTMAEADAFMLALVRLVEKGQWDETKLREILRDLTHQTLDFDLTISGFDAPEIDLILGEIQNAEPLDEVPLPARARPAISRTGDLWNIGDNHVFVGNALELQSYKALLGENKAQAVVTDPPYNVPITNHVSRLNRAQHPEFPMASGEMSPQAFTHFLTTASEHLIQFSVDGSLHYLFSDWRHMREMLDAGRGYTELKNLCVWAKTNPGMGSLYRSQHELVFVFKNGAAANINNVELGRFGRNRSNVWSYPGMSSLGKDRDEALAAHPTPKPVTMLTDAILDCTNRGDIVLDAFAGSGSTLIAAHKTGRRGFGIEIDPYYVDVIIRRFASTFQLTANHALTGETFDEIARQRVAEQENQHVE